MQESGIAMLRDGVPLLGFEFVAIGRIREHDARDERA